MFPLWRHNLPHNGDKVVCGEKVVSFMGTKLPFYGEKVAPFMVKKLPLYRETVAPFMGTKLSPLCSQSCSLYVEKSCPLYGDNVVCGEKVSPLYEDIVTPLWGQSCPLFADKVLPFMET